MAFPNHILGVILAGGQSRRFGGGDKGFADLDGRPVLSHVIERFRPQIGRLILNANGDLSRFASFGLEVVADREIPGQGPLSGILTALEWAKRHAPDCTAVATVSTDVPFLAPNLIQRLEAERGDRVAIAVSAGRRHPTIAIWPLTSREAVADLFRSGNDPLTIIRWKDIHAQLEDAVDACEQAADVLEAIFVKNR